MATYETVVDWNNDGDYSDMGEDVSARVSTRNKPVTLEFGRDQARSLSPSAPGRAQFDLDNISRDYSPENASSPLAGNLLPGRRVRFRGTHLSTTYTLYQGRIDDYHVSPVLEDRLAEFTALDGLADLKTVTLSTEVFQKIRSGQAINIVLDACGWTAGRDIDAGASIFPWWWVEGDDGLKAVLDILASEGPDALAFIGPSGEFVFRDRHHRLIRTASTTPQATYTSAGVEPQFVTPFEYDAGWREVFNTVTCNVANRTLTGATTVVYSDTQTRFLAAGETVEVNVKLSNPVLNAVTPVAVTDYALKSGAVTASLSRTTGQTITIRISATSAAQIDGLALRAQELTNSGTVQITMTDAPSITKYGLRDLPYDAPWANANDVIDLLQLIVLQHADRLPIVQITLAGTNEMRLTEQFARDLSDRVTIVESELGLNADFFIERIIHTIDTDLHTTTFGCQKALAPIANAFILDSSQLDVGRVGKTGFIPTGTLFVLDNGSQGILGTNVLGY